jgi:hypothetical protein
VDAFGVIASRATGSVQALGRGGLGHLIFRLFIWHAIWRFIRLIWRVPTFGPVLFVLIIAVIIGLIVWGRRGRRPRRGTDAGPRAW